MGAYNEEFATYTVTNSTSSKKQSCIKQVVAMRYYINNCKNNKVSSDMSMTSVPDPTRSVAIAKKADRTAYDVRYGCRSEPNRRLITVQLYS